jgi:signal peptidase I
LLLAMAAVSYLVVSNFFVTSVKVVGRSMAPTLAESSFYLLNRWILHVRAPQRAEIVVLRDPLDNGLSVKRIVGVAGDRIHLTHGRIYVNGLELPEPYLPSGTPTFCAPSVQEQSFECGQREYFVLGDNRNCSLDSRAYGPVPRQKILGLIIH